MLTATEFKALKTIKYAFYNLLNILLIHTLKIHKYFLLWVDFIGLSCSFVKLVKNNKKSYNLYLQILMWQYIFFACRFFISNIADLLLIFIPYSCPKMYFNSHLLKFITCVFYNLLACLYTSVQYYVTYCE